MWLKVERGYSLQILSSTGKYYDSGNFGLSEEYKQVFLNSQGVRVKIKKLRIKDEPLRTRTFILL